MAGGLSPWAVNILKVFAHTGQLLLCQLSMGLRHSLVLHMSVPLSIDFIGSLHGDSGLPLVATGVPNQPGLQSKTG